MGDYNMPMTDFSLIPIRQQTVIFYEDELTAVLVEVGGEPQTFIPLRPLADALGLGWSGQYERIQRDPVLSQIVRTVRVTRTVEATDKRPGRTEERELACLPLDFINGWLFGINASRVKDEIRDRLIRYQKECYKVLAAAFLERTSAVESSPNTAALIQIREMGRAIMQMAEEQLKFEARLTVHDQRLDKAAMVVGNLTKRVAALEQTIQPGGVINEEQASQLSQAVKTVALELGKKSGRNEFGSVYGEMYRRFGITAYKFLPARRFKEAVDWLTQWYQEITDSSGSAF